MRIRLAIATSLLLTLGVVACSAPTAPLSEQESYTQLLTDLDELILAADQHYNTTLADQPGSAAGGYAVAYCAHLRNLKNSITEAGPSVDTEDEHTRRVDGWRAEIEGLGERFSRGENLGELEYVDASGGTFLHSGSPDDPGRTRDAVGNVEEIPGFMRHHPDYPGTRAELMALKDRHPLREGDPDPDYTRALHAAVDEIAYAFDFDAAIPLPLERQEFVIDSVRDLTQDLDRRYAARQPLEMSVTITLPDGTEIEHDGHPR